MSMHPFWWLRLKGISALCRSTRDAKHDAVQRVGCVLRSASRLITVFALGAEEPGQLVVFNVVPRAQELELRKPYLGRRRKRRAHRSLGSAAPSRVERQGQAAWG